MKHRLTIKEIYKQKCNICSSTDVTFYVSYWSQNPPIANNGKSYPDVSKVSCKEHVAEVTAIVLREANLLGEDANDYNK